MGDTRLTLASFNRDLRFGDRALADELRALEDQHRRGPRPETIARIIEVD